MRKVDLSRTRGAAEELQVQKKQLDQLREELNSIESQIRTLSKTEEVLNRIHRCGERMEEQADSIRQMADSLTEILQVYQDTEARIKDSYTLEWIIYPEVATGYNPIKCYPDLVSKVKITLRQEDMV